MQAVRQFLDWCSDNNYDATSPDDLDDLLTEYFHDMYEQNDGVGKGLAANTYYGLIKYMPRRTDKLLTVLLSFKGWLRLRPAVSYPPLTWDLTVLIACHMARPGHLYCAIGTLLAFDCFLRVGELVNLRKCDVALTGDVRLGTEYHWWRPSPTVPRVRRPVPPSVQADLRRPGPAFSLRAPLPPTWWCDPMASVGSLHRGHSHARSLGVNQVGPSLCPGWSCHAAHHACA